MNVCLSSMSPDIPIIIIIIINIYIALFFEITQSAVYNTVEMNQEIVYIFF